MVVKFKGFLPTEQQPTTKARRERAEVLDARWERLAECLRRNAEIRRMSMGRRY